MNNLDGRNQKNTMSENQRRNLAALSRIDEDIIEKNTAKRIKLLAAVKRRTKRNWIVSISAAAACLALLAASLLILIPILGKQVPVYTGMTVSNTAPTAQATASVDMPTYLAPGNGNGNAYGNKHLWGDHRGNDHTIGEEPFDKPLTETIGSIDVESAEPRYYARPMEDIYITVHIDNPDNFVILSFTLNGQMYSSYMFEEGSDLENLILKVNVGDVEGIVSYTIDAIKYVDGTDIKDAKFDGDRTVEIGVYSESQPAVTVSSEVIGYNTLSFTANAQDALGLIGLSEGNVQAVLYDGERIVATKDLAAVGDTAVTFEGLKTGTLYQYAIIATYDALDGKGISSYILAEKAFYTRSIVLFDEVEFNTTTVSYSFYWDEAFANKALTGLALYQGDAKVRDVDVTATAVADLLPNTEYTLIATYQNGEQSEQISITFKTDMLSYTVNHYLENLDGTYEKIDTASEAVDLGATIAPDINAYEGFTSPEKQSIVATADGALLIEYYYTRNSYEVTFINNDGTTEIVPLKYGAALEAAARDGFYFDGFYAEETFQNGVSVVPANALTVFAKWLPETTTADLRYAVDGETVIITKLVNTTLSELHIPAYIGGKTVVRIADAAFLNAMSLVSVVIPDSVTAIGLNVFGGCNALTRLTVPHIGASTTQKTYIGHWFGAPSAEAQSTYVPSGLRAITVSHAVGDGAFMGCAFLESVTLGNDIRVIGASAFENCVSLQSIALPTSLESVGTSAFAGCTALAELTLPFTGAAKDGTENTHFGYIFGAASTDEHTTAIPATLKTVVLTGSSVPASAFRDCISLSCVKLPVATTIGTMAFYGCSAMETVVFAQSLIEIGASSFVGCSALRELLLPASLTTIRFAAFQSCTALTSVHIPAGVTKLGVSADEAASRNPFSGCVALTSITVAAGNTVYRSEGNCIIEVATDTVVAGCKTSVIPAGILTIGNAAFRGQSGLTTIILPDSLISIGVWAFADCTALAEISIPAGLNEIGNGAFSGTALTTVTIPAGVTAIRSQTFDGCTSLTDITISAVVTTVGSYAFRGCPITTATVPTTAIAAIPKTNLQTVVLNGGDSIPANAFKGSTALTNVTIPVSVISIDSSAFSGCTGLTEIAIPASVKAIGSSAFANCTGLTKVVISDLAAWCGITFGNSDANPLYYAVRLYLGESEITVLNIPQGVTSIGAFAFWNATSITSVTIPASVTSIGANAFGSCTALTKVAISDLAAWCDIAFANETANPLSLANYLYLGENEITALEIPAGVTSIGAYAFYNAASIVSVTVPAGVTSIGTGAFTGCKITRATMPTTAIDDIPQDSLTTVVLNGGEHIPSEAFCGAPRLQEVTVPASVISIGYAAFAEWGIPESGVTAVTFAEGSKLESIGAFAFQLSDLSSIELPAGVKSIGSHAFSGCDKLTNITIPASVTSIGIEAFGNCPGLTKVTISDLAAWCKISFGDAFANPLYYGEHLYLGDTEITALEIPAGVTSIDAYAFYNAASIVSVTIHAGVTSIGTDAFTGCAITTATMPTTAISAIPKTNLQTVVLNGGECIPANAFKECTTLTGVTIPASVISIDDEAFMWCENLASVILAADSRLESIGDGAFSLSGLKSIEIPAGVISIGDRAFGESYLKTITFAAGSKLESIGRGAFGLCGLSNIEIPAGVISIGDHAFAESRVAAVTFAEGSKLESIGNSAFWMCSNLSNITLPEGVKSIGAGAFKDCTDLTAITFAETTDWYYVDTTTSTEVAIDVTDTALVLKKLQAGYQFKRNITA